MKTRLPSPEVNDPAAAALPHAEPVKSRRAYRRMAGRPLASAAYTRVVPMTDELKPVPSKAKAKLELKDRKDLDVTALGRCVRTAMTGNPRFPIEERVPSDEEFDASLNEFEAVLVELENLRLLAMALTKKRDGLRERFERTLTRRATYVQIASQGDAAWINSAGIAVQKDAQAVGTLPAPLALRITRTNVDGEFLLRWKGVKHAKTYMLDCAEVVDGVIGEWTTIHLGGRTAKLVKGVEAGKTYAYRVAAVGGDGGHSAFSPPVQRTAA